VQLGRQARKQQNTEGEVAVVNTEVKCGNVDRHICLDADNRVPVFSKLLQGVLTEVGMLDGDDERVIGGSDLDGAAC